MWYSIYYDDVQCLLIVTPLGVGTVELSESHTNFEKQILGIDYTLIDYKVISSNVRHWPVARQGSKISLFSGL